MSHSTLVDARCLALPHSGIGKYVDHLLCASGRIFVGVAKPGQNVRSRAVASTARGARLPDPLWNELALAPAARGHETLLCPTGQVPWSHRGRSVAIVYDVLEITDPTMHWRRRASMRLAHLSTARNADVLIVISETTRDEFRRHYGRDADLLIEPAPTLEAPPAAAVETARTALAAEANGKPLVLTVGAPIPRKNTERLAAAAVRANVHVVVVGAEGDAEVETKLARLGVSRIGYVPDEQLAALYRAVDVVAFVSLQEGFGMPVLDARSLGTRLVASNRDPVMSAAGADAVLVDPESVDDMARGIREAFAMGSVAPEALPTWEEGAKRLLQALG